MVIPRGYASNMNRWPRRPRAGSPQHYHGRRRLFPLNRSPAGCNLAPGAEPQRSRVTALTRSPAERPRGTDFIHLCQLRSSRSWHDFFPFESDKVEPGQESEAEEEEIINGESLKIKMPTMTTRRI
ncbi:hypothetical protein BRADI_1g39185v3 [Brachypodium distachyon]|uniref:Uncharacterized protein n=1 Tax=Brachypodium distachyon TaxID=15368 RepID=A0A0Q3NL58_BRADI|nr:hypothetical protein BRADI_1g39185v3 [Brachypodium distachyon]